MVWMNFCVDTGYLYCIILTINILMNLFLWQKKKLVRPDSYLESIKINIPCNPYGLYSVENIKLLN